MEVPSQKEIVEFKRRQKKMTIETTKITIKIWEKEVEEYKWLFSNWERIGKMLSACSDSEIGRETREATKESMNDTIECLEDMKKILQGREQSLIDFERENNCV